MQGSHSHGKPGKKIHAWKNHGILKKDIFMEFCFSYPHFFNIRINFAEFILCTSVPF